MAYMLADFDIGKRLVWLCRYYCVGKENLVFWGAGKLFGRAWFGQAARLHGYKELGQSYMLTTSAKILLSSP